MVASTGDKWVTFGSDFFSLKNLAIRTVEVILVSILM